jgi:hypothetical protein
VAQQLAGMAAALAHVTALEDAAGQLAAAAPPLLLASAPAAQPGSSARLAGAAAAVDSALERLSFSAAQLRSLLGAAGAGPGPAHPLAAPLLPSGDRVLAVRVRSARQQSHEDATCEDEGGELGAGVRPFVVQLLPATASAGGPEATAQRGSKGRGREWCGARGGGGGAESEVSGGGSDAEDGLSSAMASEASDGGEPLPGPHGEQATARRPQYSLRLALRAADEVSRPPPCRPSASGRPRPRLPRRRNTRRSTSRPSSHRLWPVRPSALPRPAPAASGARPGPPRRRCARSETACSAAWRCPSRQR